MLFYDDVDSSWPRIYPNRGSMSCEIKALNATGSRIIEVGIPQTEYFIDLVRFFFKIYHFSLQIF